MVVRKTTRKSSKNKNKDNQKSAENASEGKSGREASAETFRNRDAARSSQEPQPEVQNPRAYHTAQDDQDYDLQDHSARSAVRKKFAGDPMQTPKGAREYKRQLAVDEGAKQEAPYPRGLPLQGEARRQDERSRGLLRDSDIGQATDDEIAESDESYVLVELCPPLRTYTRVGDVTIYRQEDAPFRVSESKARELFALRNDMHQPLFRNFRERVSSKARTQSGTMVDTVPDEVPEVYRGIMARRRPNNQAPEDEVVLTQRGVVSKGRDDVAYADEVDGVDRRGESPSGSRAEGSRRRVSSVPDKARQNSGDLQSGELRKGGGVRV